MKSCEPWKHSKNGNSTIAVGAQDMNTLPSVASPEVYTTKELESKGDVHFWRGVCACASACVCACVHVGECV